MLPIPTDPISAVSGAVTAVANLASKLSDKTHPILYHWRMWRLCKIMVRECKKEPSIVPSDLVKATCDDLSDAEQNFILQLVKERLAGK